jgi:hypothetical protein
MLKYAILTMEKKKLRIILFCNNLVLAAHDLHACGCTHDFHTYLKPAHVPMHGIDSRLSYHTAWKLHIYLTLRFTLTLQYAYPPPYLQLYFQPSPMPIHYKNSPATTTATAYTPDTQDRVSYYNAACVLCNPWFHARYIPHKFCQYYSVHKWNIFHSRLSTIGIIMERNFVSH